MLIFFGFIALNVAIACVWIFFFNYLDDFFEPAFFALVFQIVWLFLLFQSLCFEVYESGGFINLPTVFGWELIALGLLITLALYYFLSILLAVQIKKRGVLNTNGSRLPN